jgi:hypothetical protein
VALGRQGETVFEARRAAARHRREIEPACVSHDATGRVRRKNAPQAPAPEKFAVVYFPFKDFFAPRVPRACQTRT